MAAAKQQQLHQIQMQQQQQQNIKTSLPNFNLSRDDMGKKDLNLLLPVRMTFASKHYLIFQVVPQPVYMNMNELAALAAQKAAMNNDYSPLADDSPDLKTPTAEDITIPTQKVNSRQFIAFCESLH